MLFYSVCFITDFDLIKKLFFIIIKALIQISNSIQCYACESCNDPFNTYNAPILYLLDNQGFNCTVK